MKKVAVIIVAIMTAYTAIAANAEVRGLYQMNTTGTAASPWGESRTYVPNSSGLGGNLWFGGNATGLGTSQYLPTVVSGGVTGNALSFDGVSNQAFADVWPTAVGTYPDGDSKGFTIDIWFNPVDAGVTQIIAQTSTFALKIQGGSLLFLVGTKDDMPWVGNAGWGLWDVRSNEWNHFVGTVLNGSITGTLTNSITNQKATVPLTGSIAPDPTLNWMSVGCHLIDKNLFFNGKIDDLKLEFIQSPAPVDDANTVALWHMNSLTSGKVADDDSAHAGRNHDLTLNGPVITTGGQGKYGEALSFDFTDDVATATGVWDTANPPLNFQVDVWFKPDNNLTYWQTLVYVENVFELQIGGAGSVYFKAFDSSTDGFTIPYQDSDHPGWGMWDAVYNTNNSNGWNHFVGTVAHGVVTGALSNDPLGTAYGSVPLKGDLLVPTSGTVYVGNDPTGTRPYGGLLDEVKISVLPVVCGDRGYSVADFNKDCIVDFKDFTIFAQNWLVTR